MWIESSIQLGAKSQRRAPVASEPLQNADKGAAEQTFYGKQLIRIVTKRTHVFLYAMRLVCAMDSR
jgi:hypothetical protein